MPEFPLQGFPGIPNEDASPGRSEFLLFLALKTLPQVSGKPQAQFNLGNIAHSLASVK
jgi:hypothetical protein